MIQILNVEKLKQITETNVFEMRKLIKNNKGHNPKNVKKTKYVQKLFMGFERQQLAGKVENNKYNDC